MVKTCVRNLLSFIKCKTHWLSFLAGASLVFAYAPFEQWWLTFPALGIWLWLLDNKDNSTKVQTTYAFALGWFTSGISWVHVSIAEFGGMPLVVSLLLMFLLCMYLALYPALAIWLCQKLSQRLSIPPQHFLYLLPSFWLLSEYLRSVVMTGFPWLSLGYTQINSPLNQFAPVIGEVGISFVLLLSLVALIKLIKQQQVVLSTITMSVIGASLVIFSHSQWLTTSERTITTAQVQGNIKQALKWQPEHEWPTLTKYLSLTQAQTDVDLFIWPESAIPALEPQVQSYLSIVNEAVFDKDAALITGIINYNLASEHFYNTLITVGKSTENSSEGIYQYEHNNRYNKNHLLPIGEFVPFENLLRPLAPLFNLPMSSFARGDYQQQNLLAKGISVLPLICFEIAFPEQLSENFNDNTQLLLTVSNDAWFADSHGPHQHMEIARMRALEFGRPLVRTTNTGITAAVDHHGRFINRLPQFEEGVLISKIALVTGRTPYSVYGNTSIYLLALLFLLVTLFGLKRQKSNFISE